MADGEEKGSVPKASVTLARFVALDFDATGNRGRTFDKPLAREFPQPIGGFARFWLRAEYGP